MRITYMEEERFIKNVLKGIGLNENDAAEIAEMVTYADFTGVRSHGLSRFLLYANSFKYGGQNKHPEIKKLIDAGGISLYDCDNALGIIAVNHVYRELKKKALELGIAAGFGKNASNFGCAALYGRKAGRDNLISIFMGNTSPCMAPFGGADKILGTNPIMISSPAGESDPIILDMSTSRVSMGKIIDYSREKRPLEPGWANDRNGVPTLDSASAYAVTPMADYKGYGLAAFVDILSGVLSGGHFGSMIKNFNPMKPEGTSFMMILIDPEKLMPIDEYRARAEEFRRMMKESKKAEGVDEIFLPGEIELKCEKKNRENGIEISENLVEDLRRFVMKAGLTEEGEDITKLFR